MESRPGMKAVHFGIRNRQSPALVDRFFDPGMPAEWRVAFLLNEHDALWVDAGADDTDRVLEELADAPAPVFVVVEAARWTEDWERLAAERRHAVVRLDPETPVWRPDATVSGARLGLIPASDDPSCLKAWLEDFLAQAPESAALFVDGEPPSTTTVDRLKTLAELMGL
jgi:hypothetical protein